jgi:hypothetical protein
LSDEIVMVVAKRGERQRGMARHSWYRDSAALAVSISVRGRLPSMYGYQPSAELDIKARNPGNFSADPSPQYKTWMTMILSRYVIYYH